MGQAVERTVTFTPTRVDDCGEYYIVIGSLGELAKLDRDGTLIGGSSIPFASTITHSTPLVGHWIGIWVEAEMRLARIASLKLDDLWENGVSRGDLRTSLNPMRLHPQNSVWSHALDSEPTCITSLGDNFCFILRGKGVYQMDLEANEVWRSSLPRTIDGKLRGLETAISISQSKNSLSLWYDNGLVVDISLDSGIEIDRRSLRIPDRIERIFHSEKSHLLALAGGGFLISDGEQILAHYSTPGPLFAAVKRNEEWKFTGWRFDGRLSNSGLEISSRNELGVGFVADKVLTNDGTLCEFSVTRS